MIDGDCRLMIVPNNENKILFFTIQYTKKELDQIQSEFVEQMRSKYIARVNNRIIKTLEEIEKEETTAVTGKSSSYKKDDDDYSF